MSSASFRIAFEGDPFREGEIDVRDLDPALLALGDVIQAANKALNGEQADARLKVRATQEGSFEAMLMLDVSWVADILDTISAHPERVVAAQQMVDLLMKGGAVAVGTGLGLFKTLQYLRGRKPDKVEENPGGADITINQTTLSVDHNTMKLLQDRDTRVAVEKFGEKALSIRGISSLRLGQKESENECEFTISDRPVFMLPEPQEEEPEKSSVRGDFWLKIVTSQFKDGYKWRFTDGGERTLTANIEDQDFLNGVLSGDISLSANDMLLCRVREEQEVRSSGLSKSVYVEKVLEHRQGAMQLKLI